MSQTSAKIPYDELATDYDRLFVTDNSYYASISECEFRVFDCWVPRVNRGLALDIGCGTGLHTQWLTSFGYETTAVDQSSKMLEVAKNKVGISSARPQFIQADACSPAFLNPAGVDVVSCLGSTLNHIPDWQKFAAHVARALKPGGRFIFTYDNLLGIDTIARLVLREYSGYSKRYIRDIAGRRLMAICANMQFQNHWIVPRREGETEVELFYERTGTWKKFLNSCGLEISYLTGVHLIDCWNRDKLRASAGIIGVDNCVQRAGDKSASVILEATDRFLGDLLYPFAANIVGVAIKK